MYFPDLGNECQVDRGPYVRAIGWLSGEQPFSKGSAPMEFVEALRRHLIRPWQPVCKMGVHACEICSMDPAEGGNNVWIPGPGFVYVAPELVLHYVEAHGYKPPAEFIEATLACPEQASKEYCNKMRQFPAWWVSFLDIA